MSNSKPFYDDLHASKVSGWYHARVNHGQTQPLSDQEVQDAQVVDKRCKVKLQPDTQNRNMYVLSYNPPNAIPRQYFFYVDRRGQDYNKLQLRTEATTLCHLNTLRYEGNRPLNETNTKKLTEQVMLNQCFVNTAFYCFYIPDRAGKEGELMIADGQHRFEALKSVNEDIQKLVGMITIYVFHWNFIPMPQQLNNLFWKLNDTYSLVTNPEAVAVARTTRSKSKRAIAPISDEEQLVEGLLAPVNQHVLAIIERLKAEIGDFKPRGQPVAPIIASKTSSRHPVFIDQEMLQRLLNYYHPCFCDSNYSQQNRDLVVMKFLVYNIKLSFSTPTGIEALCRAKKVSVGYAAGFRNSGCFMGISLEDFIPEALGCLKRNADPNVVTVSMLDIAKQHSPEMEQEYNEFFSQTVASAPFATSTFTPTPIPTPIPTPTKAQAPPSFSNQPLARAASQMRAVVQTNVVVATPVVATIVQPQPQQPQTQPQQPQQQLTRSELATPHRVVATSMNQATSMNDLDASATRRRERALRAAETRRRRMAEANVEPGMSINGVKLGRKRKDRTGQEAQQVQKVQPTQPSSPASTGASTPDEQTESEGTGSDYTDPEETETEEEYDEMDEGDEEVIANIQQPPVPRQRGTPTSATAIRPPACAPSLQFDH